MKTLLSRGRPYSNEYLYSALGISRQSLWSSDKRSSASSANVSLVKELVLKLREHHPGMGSREMYHSLKNKGTPPPFGINKFEDTVSALGLCAGRPKTKKPMGSDGKGKKDYPNLASGLVLVDINKLLVGDITYISIGRKWHYIFTLKDVYSQFILALVPSPNMKAANVLSCIGEAVKARGKKALRGAIFHTDNGSQYEAGEVLALLEHLHVVVSRAKDCQQNGSAEQLNNLVKNQYLEHWSPRSFQDLEKACRKVTRLHNHERAIPQLGNISPVEFERRLASIPLDQRPIKKMHEFN